MRKAGSFFEATTIPVTTIPTWSTSWYCQKTFRSWCHKQEWFPIVNKGNGSRNHCASVVRCGNCAKPFLASCIPTQSRTCFRKFAREVAWHKITNQICSLIFLSPISIVRILKSIPLDVSKQQMCETDRCDKSCIELIVGEAKENASLSNSTVSLNVSLSSVHWANCPTTNRSTKAWKDSRKPWNWPWCSWIVNTIKKIRCCAHRLWKRVKMQRAQETNEGGCTLTFFDGGFFNPLWKIAF